MKKKERKKTENKFYMKKKKAVRNYFSITFVVESFSKTNLQYIEWAASSEKVLSNMCKIQIILHMSKVSPGPLFVMHSYIL